jgi:hypothetical protein
LRRIGINPDVPAGKTAALAMINAWVAPHVITSTSELTEPEASTVLDNLAALGGVAHPEHPSTEDDTNERNPHDE